MPGRPIASCIAVLLAFNVAAALAEVEPPRREISETLIARSDSSSWIPDSLRIGPNGKRVAYGTKAGNRWRVVIDGKEGKHYDGIVLRAGGRVVFDSSDSLHYLAVKGDSIYLVEEKIRNTGVTLEKSHPERH
jgi:hypothetical protein